MCVGKWGEGRRPQWQRGALWFFKGRVGQLGFLCLWPSEGDGRRLAKKEIYLGLGCFFLLPFPPSRIFSPPWIFLRSIVFIGEVLLGFQTSPSTFPFLLFSSFFVNFDFSYFFVFLKASNININSTRKISDHKIYALKAERIPNTFENLNSFEMTLKMLKTM